MATIVRLFSTIALRILSLPRFHLNEALRLENKNRGKSSWGSLRILFYLIILTIIIFIALGKPDLITDFQSVIGALGGLGVIIPLVSKFLATGGRK